MGAAPGFGEGIISQGLADTAHEDATGGDTTPQIGCIGGAAVEGVQGADVTERPDPPASESDAGDTHIIRSTN